MPKKQPTMYAIAKTPEGEFIVIASSPDPPHTVRELYRAGTHEEAESWLFRNRPGARLMPKDQT